MAARYGLLRSSQRSRRFPDALVLRSLFSDPSIPDPDRLIPAPWSSLPLARHQPAQLSQRLHLFQQAGARDDAQPLLDGGGQLHAPQAVEMEIFGQPQFVAHAGMGLAGDLRDERQQPVRRRAESVVAVGVRLPLLACAAAAWMRASQAATGLRLTLPVEVRGRSGSGHSTQRLMR